MDIELKKYLKIGIAHSQNIKVYEYEKVKDETNLDNIEPIYEGTIDNAPENIKELYYIKVELGDPTIYYI